MSSTPVSETPRESLPRISAVPSQSPFRPAASPREDSQPQASSLLAHSPDTTPLPPPALADTAAAEAASARTATIAETTNQIASVVAARILATPALANGGDGQINITLLPSILDGSTVTLTARNGTLAVAVVPATPEAAALAAAALPNLADALAAHAPSFRHVQVALAPLKGTSDEAD